jgi:hypothetical protein
MRISILVITVALAGILMIPGSAMAKELSGNEAAVMEMFENFNELETHFRNSKWEEAEKVVTKVESDYLGLVGKLKGTVDGKTLQKFSFLMSGFKKTMSRKHAEDMEKPYMKIQNLFVDMMEQLDYPSPPVLIIIDLFIEETEEFLEEGDLHQVAEEMEEIEFFEDRAIDEAREHKMDVKNLKELFELGEEINELAEDNKGKDKIAKMLEEMDSIMHQYLN